MFMSISSNTSARRPVGWSYSTSRSLITFPCGLRRRNAWISRRLFTWSKESKWFFMHLIATYFPFLMHCAFRTSLNVPSPFFATRRYSEKRREGGRGGRQREGGRETTPG